MRSVMDIREAEHKRLRFMLKTYGYKATQLWVAQTIACYKMALKTPYGKSYRRELIVSLVELRWYRRTA